MTSFDGTNLIITLDGSGGSGVLNLDVEADLYSAWKDWFKTGTNSKFVHAFSNSSGGEDVVGVLDSGSYFRLNNDLGWRIKPAEEDYTVYVTGNLVPADSALPMLTSTTGAFTVGIFGIQPITQIVGLEGLAKRKDVIVFG